MYRPIRIYFKSTDLKWCHLQFEFAAVFLIQLVSIGVAIGVLILLATIYDAGSRSMSWFSNNWLIFGLFYCPLIFCLGIGPATYVSFKNKVKLCGPSHFSFTKSYV